MRISDWSSDVCSSDLVRQFAHIFEHTAHRARAVESSLGTAKHFDASKVVDIAIGRVPTASGEGRAAAVGNFIDVNADSRTHIDRSEEHTSELQSIMRISYAVFCLKKKKNKRQKKPHHH